MHHLNLRRIKYPPTHFVACQILAKYDLFDLLPLRPFCLFLLNFFFEQERLGQAYQTLPPNQQVYNA